MHDCIFKLLRAGDEESLESMCKLLFTIGKDLDSDKAKVCILTKLIMSSLLLFFTLSMHCCDILAPL